MRYPGRRLPIFVDDVGTRCAMGHLIERGGGGDLVRHVSSRHNLARVHQLAALPAFVAWLLDNGLTVDEAALIQPTYCETAADCVCSNATYGMLEGEASTGETGLALTITAVHGDVGDLLVGDTVALGQYTQAEAGDLVLTSLNDGGVLNGEWVVDDGQISVQDCSFVAPPPGPLSVDVFIDATLADWGDCLPILDEHDPAWTEPHGDCGNEPGYPQDPGDPGMPFFPGSPSEPGGGAGESQSSNGCTITPGLSGDLTSAVILLLGAGWLLIRRRR